MNRYRLRQKRVSKRKRGRILYALYARFGNSDTNNHTVAPVILNPDWALNLRSENRQGDISLGTYVYEIFKEGMENEERINIKDLPSSFHYVPPKQ